MTFSKKLPKFGWIIFGNAKVHECPQFSLANDNISIMGLATDLSRIKLRCKKMWKQTIFYDKEM